MKYALSGAAAYLFDVQQPSVPFQYPWRPPKCPYRPSPCCKKSVRGRLTVTFHCGVAPTSSNLVPNSSNVTWREREREKRKESIIYARGNIYCSLFTQPKFKCILIIFRGPLPEPCALSREGSSVLLCHYHPRPP